ncbi:MAG: GAF domain-containing protein [Chloroflexota bacterium]
MPQKKQKIDKRINTLFDGVKAEEAQAKTESAAPPDSGRGTARLPHTGSLVRPRLAGTGILTQRVDSIVVDPGSERDAPASMSIGFQIDQTNWATLHAVDEEGSHTWSTDDQLLFKQVTDQLSLALENARLFQETRSRAEELALLNEMGRELASLFSVETITEAVYKHASRLMNTDNLFISLYDEAKQEITPIFVVNNRQRVQASPRRLGKGLSDHILRTHEPLFIPDNMPIHMQKLGLEVITMANDPTMAQCWLGAPLLVGDAAIGVIAVQSVEAPRVYTERHRDLLVSIAGHAAIAIQNARLFEETQRRNRELSALNDIISSASQTLDLDAILKNVLQRVLDVIGFDAGLISLVDDETKKLKIRSWIELPQSMLDKFEVDGLDGTLCHYVYETKKTLFLEDLRQEAPVDVVGLLANNLNSYLGVPLESKGHTLGTLCVFGRSPRPHDQSVIELAQSVSIQIGFTLENARLFETIRASEAQLSEALRIARLANWEYDFLHDVFTVNDQFYNVMRTSVEREGGYAMPSAEYARRFFHPGDAASIEAEIINAIRTTDAGFSASVEHRAQFGDGSIGYILMQFRIQKNAEGQTVKAFGANQDITDRKIGELIQTATAQITEAAVSATGLEEVLQTVHAAVRRLAPADNFFIALYEPEEGMISFPYFVDEKDPPPPPMKYGLGMTSYVIQQGIPVLVTPEAYDELQEKGLVIPDGSPGVDWLGIPLRSARGIRGVMTIQTYDPNQRLKQSHVQALEPLAAQVAAAIERFEARDALSKSEADLRTLFSAMDDVVLVFNREGRYIRIAPTNPSLLVRTPEELLGKLMHEVLPTETADRFVSAICQTLDSGEKQQLEYDLNIGKETFWFLATLSKLNAEEVFWVARDITERKLAEQDLTKFKLGIESSGDAIFITDTKGVINFANSAFERIYGYAPEEVIGQNPRIIKSGVTPLEYYENLWSSLLSKKTLTAEINNRHKDGHLVPIAGTNSPILDEKGSIIGFLAVHHDNTASKQAEQALQRRNTYLAASSEIARLVTSTLDLSTLFSRTVSLVHDRFGLYHAAIFIVEETGFTATLQEAASDVGAAMKAQKHSLEVGSNSIVGQVTQTGAPIIVNDTQVNSLHKVNPLLPDTRAEAAIPLRVGSRTIGALDLQSTEVNAFSEDDIAVLQTLADQVAIAIDNARSYELSIQAVREMREIDRLKTTFLANMSHELRTPLNSIIGFSRVILKGIDGPVTELQQSDLTAIYNSGQHLLGLINDILDVSKIEAGKMELAFEEVNMHDIITSVMSTVSGLVKDKPIRLVKNIAPDLPHALADPIRIRQVLINLFSNAAKFTDEGLITVEAHPQIGANGKTELYIAVTDSGPGIAEKDQSKLFQPFSQVDDAPTRKTGGSGLGLSISQRLVQLHGGQIKLHSKLGEGTTFYFNLPAYQEPPQASPDSKLVLAIDDDPQVISLYERYLQASGYQVIPLSDPSQAVQRVAELKPFAVTLDILMPGVDGWQVLTELKSNPETRDIPVMICSIIEDQERGFSLGAADYLVKPILEEDLVHALDRLNQDGSIREVLVIDDNPNDLKLIGKMLVDNGRYQPLLAEGGEKGWEMLLSHPPQAVILDLFMPSMDGFKILENMRLNRSLNEIPVIVVSGGDLNPEQRRQIEEYGRQLLSKSSLSEQELIANLEQALKRAKAP